MSMSISDVLLIGMMAPTFLAAILVIGYRLSKDMYKLRRLDAKIAKAQRNMFRWNRGTGNMAVRNK